MIALQQFKVIFYNSLTNEWRNKERLFTPVLFALVIILIFKFTSTDFTPETEIKVLIGQILVTCFLALQISFQRIFELDEQDGVFAQIQTYQVSPTSWFVAKFLNIVILSFFITSSVFFFLYLFHSEYSDTLCKFLIPISLAILSLSPLGILLSALTMQARGKQIIFPLLYFPLSTPVLISSSSLCLGYANQTPNGDSMSWLWLLIGICVVFFTVCLLLFSELVE